MSDPVKNELVWSLARHRVFGECPHKYFFHFYAAQSGWQADAPERLRTIYYLAKLRSRAQWVESNVKQTLRAALQRRMKNEPLLPEDDAVASMLTAMRGEFKISRGGRYRVEPARHFGLFEHEYGIAVTDAEWKETADLAQACVHAFYQLPHWATWTSKPSADILAVSLPALFDLSGLKVVIPLDLVYREKDRIVIYDWKIGGEDADEVIEAAGCALATQEEWTVPAERIYVETVSLPAGQIRKHRFNDNQLQEMRDFIHESADEMLFLLADPQQNIPLGAEEFPTTEDPQTCRRCNFLKVCPKWAQQIS